MALINDIYLGQKSIDEMDDMDEIREYFLIIKNTSLRAQAEEVLLRWEKLFQERYDIKSIKTIEQAKMFGEASKGMKLENSYGDVVNIVYRAWDDICRGLILECKDVCMAKYIYEMSPPLRSSRKSALINWDQFCQKELLNITSISEAKRLYLDTPEQGMSRYMMMDAWPMLRDTIEFYSVASKKALSDTEARNNFDICDLDQFTEPNDCIVSNTDEVAGKLKDDEFKEIESISTILGIVKYAYDNLDSKHENIIWERIWALKDSIYQINDVNKVTKIFSYSKTSFLCNVVSLICQDQLGILNTKLIDIDEIKTLEQAKTACENAPDGSTLKKRCMTKWTWLAEDQFYLMKMGTLLEAERVYELMPPRSRFSNEVKHIISKLYIAEIRSDDLKSPEKMKSIYENSPPFSEAKKAIFELWHKAFWNKVDESISFTELKSYESFMPPNKRLMSHYKSKLRSFM